MKPRYALRFRLRRVQKYTAKFLNSVTIQEVDQLQCVGKFIHLGVAFGARTHAPLLYWVHNWVAIVTSGTYQAFLSYSHADDEFLDGSITWLRRELEKASRAVTGREFVIFQDSDGIAFGKNWQNQLDTALESATVLLPILTPSFFTSDACCSEVLKFLAYEESLGREDLILPVYMIDASHFDSPSSDANGQIIQVLSERQYRDWRRIAFDLRGSKDIKLRVANLAREIAQAVETRKAPRSDVNTAQRVNAFDHSKSDPETARKLPTEGKMQEPGLDSALEAAYEADALITLSRNKTVLGPSPTISMRDFVFFMNHFFDASQNNIENDRLFIWVLDLGNRVAQATSSLEDLSDFAQFYNAGTLALFLKAFQSFDLEANIPLDIDRAVPHLSIPDPTYRTNRWNWLKDRSVVFIRSLRLDELQEIYGGEEKMLNTVQLKDIGITIEHLLPRERPPESWRAEMKRIYGRNAQTAGATITAFFRETPWKTEEVERNVRYFAHRERSRPDAKSALQSRSDQPQTHSAELPSPGLHHDTALQLLYWGARYRLGQISDIEIESGIHSLAYLKNMGFRALHLNHFMNIFSHI